MFAGALQVRAQQPEQVIEIPLPGWLQVKESAISRDSILVGEQVVWSTVMEMPQEQEIMFAPYSAVVEAEKAPIDVVHDIQIDTLAIKNGKKELQAMSIFTTKIMVIRFRWGFFRLIRAEIISMPPAEPLSLMVIKYSIPRTTPPAMGGKIPAGK